MCEKHSPQYVAYQKNEKDAVLTAKINNIKKEEYIYGCESWY
jgi:hypothetical protein